MCIQTFSMTNKIFFSNMHVQGMADRAKRNDAINYLKSKQYSIQSVCYKTLTYPIKKKNIYALCGDIKHILQVLIVNHVVLHFFVNNNFDFIINQ
jgi:hypothetical protein